MFMLVDSMDGEVLVEFNYNPEDINETEFKPIVDEMEYPSLDFTQPVPKLMEHNLHDWRFKDYSSETWKFAEGMI